MKKLPIGVQDFNKIIEQNCVYVDKTENLYKLITSGSYYFLSRPRRFGKSLLVSTLKEIFSGNSHLFKGLWIENKIDWKPYPVIHLSFSSLSHKTLGLVEAIENWLSDTAQKHEIVFNQTTYPLQFQELIQKLSQKGRVVILIDEYDKPIIDYIDDRAQAEANRTILKNFYSIVKDNDAFIQFFFVTGVSKFSQVSIFSDLNHLTDLTINKNYSTLLGCTQEELEFYFHDRIDILVEQSEEDKTSILQKIKHWYNGYSWDGKRFVYNPFSILNLFSSNTFENYWFKTATPNFLIKLLKTNNYDVSELNDLCVTSSTFDKYEIEKMSSVALMFQTGYLTIKEYNPKEYTYTLDYPNFEVARSFSDYLLSGFTEKEIESNNLHIRKITTALKNNEIKLFIELMRAIFADIPYHNIDKKEKYFHSIFYLIIKMLGFTIQSEVLTNFGRIDCVVQTADYVYVIEFKVGKASDALAQIKERHYADKYLTDSRKVILLGIGFDSRKKNIKQYLVENAN